MLCNDAVVLPVHAAAIRLFLHLLAATMWVGGQLTLAGLVPVVRGLGGDATRQVARQFNRLAWPAYAVLVATGLWNIQAVHLASASRAYKVTLVVKLVLVAVSGIGAAAHVRARSKAVLAVGGAMSALGAVGALLLGVMLNP